MKYIAEMEFDYQGFKVVGKVTKFHAKETTPKTYRKQSLLGRRHGSYDSGICTLYKVGNEFRVGTYVDGCFWMQYAKVEFSEDAFDKIDRCVRECAEKEHRLGLQMINGIEGVCRRQELKDKVAKTNGLELFQGGTHEQVYRS